MKVNGEDTPTEITIDLSGHFLNFAPIASGNESDKGAACEENTNQTEIHLDASASFEIYGDALSTNPADYQWYEDYALVTEKHLGTGKQLTIPKHQLTFGIHRITLVLRDGHGIADMDTFDVDVYDTVPPSLTVPDDVTLLIPPDVGGSQFVDIGKASASDTCSDQVMISNDAPDDLIFQLGTTTVTWTADDGRGNVTTDTQQIELVTLVEPDMVDSGDIDVLEPNSPDHADPSEATPAGSICGAGVGQAAMLMMFGLMFVQGRATNRCINKE